MVKVSHDKLMTEAALDIQKNAKSMAESLKEKSLYA